MILKILSAAAVGIFIIAAAIMVGVTLFLMGGMIFISFKDAWIDQGWFGVILLGSIYVLAIGIGVMCVVDTTGRK